MKKILSILVMMFVVLGCNAQKMRYYCEIKGIEKDLSSGLKIVFDFGNNPVYSSWGGLNNKQKIVDENGEEIDFNSMVDAGNYMSSKGWNFQQAYSSIYSSKVIVHWIFYKDAESPEQAAEGIVTKDQFKKNK